MRRIRTEDRRSEGVEEYVLIFANEADRDAVYRSALMRFGEPEAFTIGLPGQGGAEDFGAAPETEPRPAGRPSAGDAVRRAAEAIGPDAFDVAAPLAQRARIVIRKIGETEGPERAPRQRTVEAHLAQLAAERSQRAKMHAKRHAKIPAAVGKGPGWRRR